LNEPDTNWAESSTLLKFDQSEFINYDQWGSSGMRSKAWLYYPDSCATTQCKLVVWLHGGGMTGVGMLNDYYGIAATAAANNMVVLLPQGDTNGKTNCWDG